MEWETLSENENRSLKEKYRIKLDPFERKSVYVEDSTLPDAGEGLFARRPISKGQLISYFSGWRTKLSSLVFSNMSLRDGDEALAFSYSIGKEAPPLWNYPFVRRFDCMVKFKFS